MSRVTIRNGCSRFPASLSEPTKAAENLKSDGGSSSREDEKHTAIKLAQGSDTAHAEKRIRNNFLVQHLYHV
jgi:hypothetical protein